jgi:small subunit ribosomal protein S1
MEQSELGKNEEQTQDTSSAELSESMPESMTENTEEQVVAEVQDTPTEVDADESAAEQEPEAEGTPDTPSAEDAAEEDDEDADIPGDDSDADDPNRLQRGQLILGTVARTTPNEIYVDLGEGREGFVPKREVEMLSGKTLEQLQDGAEVYVYVVNPRNHRGNTILSINHAQEELDWREAEKYLESKQVYDGRIGGYNKGGLIVRFGRLRGFVPQSQISDKRQLDVSGDTPEERYGGMVNDSISVKVMEVDRSRNRLILSERAAMREVRQRRKEALITELEVGEIRQGRVVSLENFGAFVDIGGAEGLVHLTELSWEHVTHPRQVLDVGQEVEVRVISVDENKNRIGLSLKQLMPDPWDELATRFGTGALLRGTVTKLTKFGAFAQIEGLSSIEGLIHISELSDERVEHPRDVVNRGDNLVLRVVKLDVPNRRLGLSLRRVNSPEFLDEDMRRAFQDEAVRVEEDDDEPQPEATAEAEAVAEPVAEETAANGSSQEEVAEPEATVEAEAEEPEATAEEEPTEAEEDAAEETAEAEEEDV